MEEDRDIQTLKDKTWALQNPVACTLGEKNIPTSLLNCMLIKERKKTINQSTEVDLVMGFQLDLVKFSSKHAPPNEEGKKCEMEDLMMTEFDLKALPLCKG